MTAPGDLLPATRNALSLLLLSMADDALVIGAADSRWSGISRPLEEARAIRSLARDELGHALALYELLTHVVADGRSADDWAYGRPPEGYYHARLLDRPCGDSADTIARHYLYDTAAAVRREALARSSFAPLRDLVAELRRAERDHLPLAEAWFERFASGRPEPRRRVIDALRRLGPHAGTVLAPLPTELALEMAGVVEAPSRELEARWRTRLAPVFERLDLPALPPTRDPSTDRSAHSDAFRRLHEDFTSRPRSDRGETP